MWRGAVREQRDQVSFSPVVHRFVDSTLGWGEGGGGGVVGFRGCGSDLPSRSDDLTVAVRLQPTGRGVEKDVASRQRRLTAKR